MKTYWKILGLAVLMGLLQLSCSSDSKVTVVISDDDLIADVSNGPAMVGVSINGFGEWAAAGSNGLAYGSGSAGDAVPVSLATGGENADRAIDLNDNGSFILAVENGIWFGDLNGTLIQVYAGNLGQFIVADINNNDIWVVASEDGVFIGGGAQEAVFLDYVNNLGEFSHCAINDYDEFVSAGSLRILYGFVDLEGVVQLYETDPVSIFQDAVASDINEYGEWIATGSLATTIGVVQELNSKVRSVLPRKKRDRVRSVPDTSEQPFTVPELSVGKMAVNYHYEPAYRTMKTRKAVAKALPIYHDCAINNYAEYIMAGDEYLQLNDQAYDPITDYNQMVKVDLNDAGQWLAAGTYGLLVDGTNIYDGMDMGDYLALKQDESGNFVYCTSYSSYHYNVSTGNLIDDGPVADNGYPVAADMENGRWISVGNYGVLLWNY